MIEKIKVNIRPVKTNEEFNTDYWKNPVVITGCALEEIHQCSDSCDKLKNDCYIECTKEF